MGSSTRKEGLDFIYWNTWNLFNQNKLQEAIDVSECFIESLEEAKSRLPFGFYFRFREMRYKGFYQLKQYFPFVSGNH